MHDFVPPSEIKCKEALIGTNNVVKKLYNKIFSLRHRLFHASHFFRSVRIVNEADWLVHHEENGQTFESFWRSNIALSKPANDRPVRPATALGHHSKRLPQSTVPSGGVKVIYIQPLGNFPSNLKDSSCHPFIIWLQSYCNAFFYSAKIRILPSIGVEDVKCEYRVNELTGRFQLNASHILTYLKKHKPRNGHCVIAVTMIDLFPKPSWDFVFGLASATHGVGIFSFARYEDLFYETWTQGKDVLGRLPDGSLDYSPFTKLSETFKDQVIKGILVLRACKVMSHEICHMFGLKHCFYHECVMNGSNHLQESDRRPPFLCPVCLRKLQAVFDFDVEERYAAMKDWASPKFWENYLHHDEKGSPMNKSLSCGRRISLPDVTQPKSFHSRPHSSSKKTLIKRPATCKLSSRRSKPVSGTGISPIQRPTSALPRPSKPSQNGHATEYEPKRLPSSSKAFKVPGPSLEAFDDYFNWLDQALIFLRNDK